MHLEKRRLREERFRNNMRSFQGGIERCMGVRRNPLLIRCSETRIQCRTSGSLPIVQVPQLYSRLAGQRLISFGMAKT